MARVFNIYLSVAGELHNGMVFVKTTPFYKEYLIRFDDLVMEMLPGDRIISLTQGEYIFPNVKSEELPPLAIEVIRALSGHLQTYEV